MSKYTVIRQAVRAVSVPSRLAASQVASRSPLVAANIRTLSSTTIRRNKDDIPRELKDATTAAPKGATAPHEGAYARTDQSVVIEYPEAHEVPRSRIVQGRGGMHFKRTLPSFSLENKVSVMTGGARGLGLVMGQALVASGSDLAIVDLNSA